MSYPRGKVSSNDGSVRGDPCLEIHQNETWVRNMSTAKILRRKIASGNRNQSAGLKNGRVRSSNPIGRRDPNG